MSEHRHDGRESRRRSARRRVVADQRPIHQRRLRRVHAFGDGGQHWDHRLIVGGWSTNRPVAELKLGYKASAEQFGPARTRRTRRPRRRARHGQCVGQRPLQPVAPRGRACAVRAVLDDGRQGERTSRIQLGTPVMTPTFRYNPAVIAQAFATMGCLYPGRVFLGVGTGEALNEIATGAITEWPEFRSASPGCGNR